MMFWEEIEKAVNEPIEAVVIGPHGGSQLDANDTSEAERVPFEWRNRVLTADEARPLLSYEYDAGYGLADCNAVFVWSAQCVALVAEYDGSTDLLVVPRNPLDTIPLMA